MKLNRVFPILAISFSASSAWAAGGILPDVFNDMPRHVFVPPGFDNNDSSEIVVRGEFRDTCYQVGPSRVRVDAEGRRIVIENQAYHYDAFLCMMVLVPYTKTIPVGILDEGTYAIQFAGDSGSARELGSITIHPSANGGQDDFVYAPVEELRVDRGELGQPHSLTLSGTFTDTCMDLADVKVMTRTADVVEVLPIVKFAGEGCKAEKRSFTRTVWLPGTIRGERLIHVRALDGQSINRVVTF